MRLKPSFINSTLVAVAILATAIGGRASAQAAAAPNPSAGVTYSGAIGPLLERKCVHCHRPGGVAPMAFMSYGDVREWAKESYTPLESLLRTRAMPPWPADPAVGDFINREFMTDAEIDLLIRWIESGLPRGDGDYQGPTLRGDWELGTPDHVFDLPEYSVAEDVTGEYRNVQIPTNFSEDRWIVGSEVRPGNTYAVLGVDAGVLGAFQPGQAVSRYPAEYATLLQKGATVDVRIHYFKEAGVEETDQGRIGVYFAPDDAPRRPVLEAAMRAEPFTIPAGTVGQAVTTRFVFETDGEILSVMPVMHARGKSVAYSIRLPGGTERQLLVIPAWNPNWKYRYQLREPIAAPKGAVVSAVAVFDNSEANLKNPDPWSDVSTGPAGETFEGWLDYALFDSQD